MRDVPIIPMGDEPGSTPAGPVASARPWQSGGRLSSTGAGPGGRMAQAAEGFLARAGFARAPWLAVLFMSGILAWFALPQVWHWLAAMGAGCAAALAAAVLWPARSARGDARVHLRGAMIAGGLVFAAGVAVIWARSEMIGAPAMAAPRVEMLQGRVLEREDQPAEGRIRLTLAVRLAGEGERAGAVAARKVRVNVPLAALSGDAASGALAEGAVVRLRARLMPPASPMLPGAYNFARAAWFKGLAATGSALGPVELVSPAPAGGTIARLQRALAAHVRARVDGSAGAIAAAFASGDRGGISEADEVAMRDSGLTHLLSISGLHVSAVIAAAYFAVQRVLALWPGLSLRLRLPVAAAAGGALAGIGYTLLTGAEVPTMRSCLAALLVLCALVLGRDALSLRMVAAGAVLLLWPESAIGPSSQMSFSAVLAIIALSNAAPVRAFLAARDEPWWARSGRRVVMLFVTGMVIELTLMPVVLFHFHRAGLYGALANVAAIPLVTFIAMPLIALGLLFDLVGAGAPFWWAVRQSLDLLLAIAHLTASQPGAVKLMPQIGAGVIALFAGGGLWLALWSGRARLWGLVPVGAASLLAALTPVPDVLVAGDGRQVGITLTEADGTRRLLSLRDGRSRYARDNLLELAGVKADPVPLAEWPGAVCSSAFCTVRLDRGGRAWDILIARTRDRIEERALATACRQSDIVIADRFLPRSCRPRWLKADRRLLERSGGLAINLADRRIATVAAGEGSHGWWKGAGEVSLRERGSGDGPQAAGQAARGQ